ncbi:carbon-nitrogen hydrolase [Nitratifractor salsuginis]|uniref:Nitrilase/cyanide hydratase and apolipoprotein N-acyltransferase n=1 Tax=Nitratifractor salsuginis (strain DSM 16511 / JCM 12458 / E9I37-1) TaxID=749222 RepID=E6WZ30_NITSE|nr:carbon-nitrogen hydrolase [Nitratifractor salsuginis]ADV45480.1 Nitrilase/cyanide hydratase and apolipoprotein N-acyltransferase [Nitratifractor salsuginis DSM 16511]
MRCSLIQQSYTGDKASMQAKTREAVLRAAGEGAELVVLQELHQSEYFCQCEDPRFFDYARSFEEDLRYWSGVAREAGVVLVTSLFEERAPGIYHNTAVVFEKDGSIAGKYRKMHIPDDPGFYEKFYFTPGDLGFEPIDTSVGRLGVLVCWDQWYPEAARIMTLKGAQLLLYPTAIGYLECPSDRRDELCEKENTPEERRKMREAWIAVQRGHAVANGVPVLAVNRVGKEKDPSGVLEGIRFWGHSFAFGPQGEPLAMAGEEEETLTLDLDLDASAEVRKIWPFLRDRRIESYEDLLQRYCLP